MNKNIWVIEKFFRGDKCWGAVDFNFTRASARKLKKFLEVDDYKNRFRIRKYIATDQRG